MTDNYPVSDADLIAQLRQRNAELESIEQEYRQLQDLLTQAAANANLDHFASQVILYCDTVTQQIVDMNQTALDVLGYDRAELLRHGIADIEVTDPEASSIRFYFESDVEIYEYYAQYRRADGYLLPMHVEKRTVPHGDTVVLRYQLEDQSFHKKLAREILRREGGSYEFTEKLKILNDINIELGRQTSFDDVCRRGVEQGIERLGFDRMSLWFLEPDGLTMRGTYGVDELGHVRDERTISWQYGRSFIGDFVRGVREPRVQSDAPIYNEKTEVIDYGWHISAPIVDGDHFVGYIAADNYIQRQPLLSYQPELLRVYGASIGHIATRQREQETIRQLRQQEMDLHIEQERVRMLENFVRDVGHEFRTPLAIISTSAYLLARTNDPEQRQNYFERTSSQLAYLNDMIGDMLYIVQMDKVATIPMQPLNISRLTHDAIAFLASGSAAKHIQWKTDLEADLMVMGEEEKLQRAIIEIIRNAIEFSHDSGTIQVALQSDHAHIYLRVQDHGIGIAPQHQQQIFNRFYRIDQARSTRGSGLGLSIARVIIEAHHHGSISLESVLDQGSTFTITLPRMTDV